jgi:hypothetical protein
MIHFFIIILLEKTIRYDFFVFVIFCKFLEIIIDYKWHYQHYQHI